jgi:hypothetical protein
MYATKSHPVHNRTHVAISSAKAVLPMLYHKEAFDSLGQEFANSVLNQQSTEQCGTYMRSAYCAVLVQSHVG